MTAKIEDGLGHKAQKSGRKFPIRPMWWQLICPTLFGAVFALMCFVLIKALSDPRYNDSPLASKIGDLGIIIWSLKNPTFLFIVSFNTLARPHMLILDHKGKLIIRSIARDSMIDVALITTIVVFPQLSQANENCNLSGYTKYTDGKLELEWFLGHEDFVRAIKTSNPHVAIVKA